MDVRRAHHDDRSLLARFAASLQRRPDSHVAYLGVEADEIAEEMTAEDEDWTAVSAVASMGDEIVGWLMGSVDPALGRVWWFGPFVDVPMLDDWISVVDTLDEFCHRLLPDGVTDEEFAPDRRFTRLVRWAEARGFVRETDAAVLVLDVDAARPFDDRPTGTSRVRPLLPADLPALAVLHDQMFPGTHSTADGLLDGADADHVRLGLEADGRLVGYIAVERQPGGDGYIDFVGVDPDARGRGFGERLVRAGIEVLAAAGCGRVCLTVREDNTTARALYERLGFEEERVIAALRRGAPSG